MNKFKTIVAVAAAAMLAFGATAQTPEEVDDKYNEAAELINNRQFAEAITVLNETIEMGLNAGPDAMETVTQAQKLLPVCYLRVGAAQAGAKNYDAAVEALEKATELSELYGDVANGRRAGETLAKVYTVMAADAFNSKDYARAAEIFARGYEANPTDTDLAMNLAKSYAEMGQTEDAYRVYREIIALEDRHSKYKEPAEQAREELAYYMMLDASKALEEGDFDSGIAVIEEILNADPANATANMMLIQTATNRKNWDKVIEKGEAAAEAQTDPALRSDAYFLLGAAYQNKENTAKAIENYRKVTEGNNVATARAQISALNN